METVRPCGCKGIRTCLICEEEYKISKPDVYSDLKNCLSYVYCPECDLAWPGWDMEIYKQHPNHIGQPATYPGVYIKLDFLSDAEASTLMTALDALPWETSQSGRRKQNYGPKCNFRKRRLRVGSFDGFPKSTKFVQDKLAQDSLLESFQTIEQCSLEYDRVRGASIDPHIDDCWIWGERIVTVNVLGDSVLTMTLYRGEKTRYNLEDTLKYPAVVPPVDQQSPEISEVPSMAVVRLPMPAKSLMVLFGAARYDWEHAVLREDIESRRVCVAYREFTPPYLATAENTESAKVFERAKNFW